MLPQAARPRGRRGTASTRFALASLLVVTALSGACTREPERGAVISAVEPAAAGARAGLAVGETVTAWTGDGAEGGPIAGPLSLLRVEIDEAPRGAVVLTVRGRSGERRVRLATGHWGLETVPAGAPEVTTDPALRAVAWETEGLALGRAGELTAARHALERALELRRGLAPESPAVARSLVHLADVDYRRQDPHGMELAERGVAAFRRFPAPLETAWALRVLANFAYVLGDLDRADRLYREALDLRLPLEPDGREGASWIRTSA
ncbi:MAG: tetratricopeptide repeat protein [Thermoanaerobaculia bacterium]